MFIPVRLFFNADDGGAGGGTPAVDDPKGDKPDNVPGDELTFDQVVSDERFKKPLQSLIDSAVSKGVESFKTNTVPGLIESELKTRIDAMNTKTPQELEMEKLKNDMAAIKNDNAEKERLAVIETNKVSALTKLNDNKIKLSAEQLKWFVSDDAEKTTANVTSFIELLTALKTEWKAEKIAGNNVTPPQGRQSANEPVDTLRGKTSLDTLNNIK